MLNLAVNNDFFQRTNEPYEGKDLALRLKQGVQTYIDEQKKKGYKITQAQIAHFFNISPAAVSSWFKKGRINKTNLKKLSRLTNISEEWYMFGYENEIYDDSKKIVKLRYTGPVAKRIPHIPWSYLSNKYKLDIQDDQQSVIDWIPVKETINENCFGLTISGDSMVSNYPGDKHNFISGSIVVFDPLKTPKNHDYVLAYNKQKKQLLFREFVLDNGVTYLKPRNIQYPTIEISNENINIIGIYSLCILP